MLNKNKNHQIGVTIRKHDGAYYVKTVRPDDSVTVASSPDILEARALHERASEEFFAAVKVGNWSAEDDTEQA